MSAGKQHEASVEAMSTGKPWSTSTRRQRLPSDWPKRRARVKARAEGICEAKAHDPECDRIGSECDHVIAGDDHSMSNLQWLSGPCHRAKTLAEVAAAQGIRRSGLRMAREDHPGML